MRLTVPVTVTPSSHRESSLQRFAFHRRSAWAGQCGASKGKLPADVGPTKPDLAFGLESLLAGHAAATVIPSALSALAPGLISCAPSSLESPADVHDE